MGKVSRRTFLAAGAAVAVVPGSLTGMKGNKAMAYDYTPPAGIPFSKERQVYNQIIAKAKKP